MLREILSKKEQFSRKGHGLFKVVSRGVSAPRLWLAESTRGEVLKRVSEAARAAQQLGARPRLVIFDYLDNPVAGQLRVMAAELDMLVSVEPISRTLPSASLRDRFRLLEKSRGVHGVFFPHSLTPTHRACLEAHPVLEAMALDKPQDGLSPHIVSFLQLAAVHGWNPEGRSASVVFDTQSKACATTLARELERLSMKVQLVAHPDELCGSLSRSALVWLCHGRPLAPARLHLSSDTVLIDSGRALEMSPSLGPGATRLLAHRLAGLCPGDQGLAMLVNLNRIHRLLLRAMGPRRPRSLSLAISQRGRARV